MIGSRLALGVMLSIMALAASVQAAAQAVAHAPQNGKTVAAKDHPALQLRLEVPRVPVDVVVTDKLGNPVRGLRKEDFELKEDKKTQKILSFDYSDGMKPSFIPPKLPPMPANTYISLPGEPEQGPLYVLYYDMVNTAPEQQMSFHQQLLEFVDKAPPGTRMALFVNAKGLHMIQGFTGDKELMREAINLENPGRRMPAVFLEGVDRWGPGNYGGYDVGAALSNLNFIAEYMNGLAGRKNLLWLSASFPIPTGPNLRNLAFTDQVYEDIKHTFASMMASRISVYLVDVGGVTAGVGAWAAGLGLSAESNQMDEDTIAGYTGGRAFYGSNRAAELMEKAVDNGASFYTLTYAPANLKRDGSERKIEVRLTKKNGYILGYRMRYYDEPLDAAEAAHKNEPVQARALAAKAADTLYANIEHGAPMLHDLVFSAHLEAAGEPVMATAEQMLQLEDAPAYFRTRHRNRPLKPLEPVKLQKYRIGYGILDSQLKLLAIQKGRPAMLEFAAAAYDDDGRLLNSMLNDGVATTESAPQGKAGPLFHADQELDAPEGAAWIRLAVRDTLTDKTGTIEVRLPLKPEAVLAAVSKGD